MKETARQVQRTDRRHEVPVTHSESPRDGTLALPSGRFLGSVVQSVELSIGRLSESSYRSGQVQERHAHALPHISLTVAGAYDEAVEGRTEGVRAGALTFYRAGLVHSERHHVAGRHFLLELDPPGDAPLAELVERFTASPTPTRPAGAIAWRLYGEFRQPDACSRLAMEALATELLVECLRRPGVRERRRPVWLDAVEELLRARLTAPPTLAEIAREVGVHPVHLARTYRKFERSTVGERLRALRVEQARERLAVTRAPLAEIALDAGFSDQSHFTRVFKRALGVTPARYRALLVR